MKKRIQPGGRYRLTLLCYGGALLIFLVCAIGGFAQDAGRTRRGQLAPKELTVDDFEPVAFIPTDIPDLYVSTDPDPHLVYEPESPFYATGFGFSGKSLNKTGGEMVLYYKTGNQQEYVESRKIWATQRPDGSWYFDLGHRKYTGLRFDPDVRGGVLWKVDRLYLTGIRPGLDYFKPNGVVLFGMLAGPAFVAALVREGMLLHRFFTIRLRAKKTNKA